MSSGKPSTCGTINMMNSRSMAPNGAADEYENDDIEHRMSFLIPVAARARPAPSGDQANHGRQHQIVHGVAAAPRSAELGGIEFHAAEGRVAAEKSCQHAGIESCSVPVTPVDGEEFRTDSR